MDTGFSSRLQYCPVGDRLAQHIKRQSKEDKL
jgi:hypothetical protein